MINQINTKSMKTHNLKYILPVDQLRNLTKEKRNTMIVVSILCLTSKFYRFFVVLFLGLFIGYLATFWLYHQTEPSYQTKYAELLDLLKKRVTDTTILNEPVVKKDHLKLFYGVEALNVNFIELRDFMFEKYIKKKLKELGFIQEERISAELFDILNRVTINGIELIKETLSKEKIIRVVQIVMNNLILHINEYKKIEESNLTIEGYIVEANSSTNKSGFIKNYLNKNKQKEKILKVIENIALKIVKKDICNNETVIRTITDILVGKLVYENIEDLLKPTNVNRLIFDCLTNEEKKTKAFSMVDTNAMFETVFKTTKNYKMHKTHKDQIKIKICEAKQVYCQGAEGILFVIKCGEFITKTKTIKPESNPLFNETFYLDWDPKKHSNTRGVFIELYEKRSIIKTRIIGYCFISFDQIIKEKRVLDWFMFENESKRVTDFSEVLIEVELLYKNGVNDRLENNVLDFEISLDDILKRDLALIEFIQFLDEANAMQFLKFWLNVENFKNSGESNVDILSAKAKSIFSLHLENSSRSFVALESIILEDINKNITAPTTELFNRAQDYVKEMLSEPFFREFKKSEYFKNFIISSIRNSESDVSSPSNNITTMFGDVSLSEPYQPVKIDSSVDPLQEQLVVVQYKIDDLERHNSANSLKSTHSFKELKNNEEQLKTQITQLSDNMYSTEGYGSNYYNTIDLRNIELKNVHKNKNGPKNSKEKLVLTLKDPKTNYEWDFVKSYKEIVNLHQKLKIIFPKVDKMDISFNSRWKYTILSKIGENETQKLIKEIQLYISLILSDMILIRSKIIKDFFDPRKAHDDISSNGFLNSAKNIIKNSVIDPAYYVHSNPTPQNKHPVFKNSSENSLGYDSKNAANFVTDTAYSHMKNYDTGRTLNINTQQTNELSHENEETIFSDTELSNDQIDLLIEGAFAVIDVIFDLEENTNNKTNWFRRNLMGVVKQYTRKNHKATIQSILEEINKSKSIEALITKTKMKLTNEKLLPDENDEAQLKSESKQLFVKFVSDLIGIYIGDHSSLVNSLRIFNMLQIHELNTAFFVENICCIFEVLFHC